MSADLKDRLDAQASENKRSLTSEITARLEESFTYPATRDALQSEKMSLEGEVEKLAKALQKTTRSLTKREEDLFNERVALRELTAERDEMMRQLLRSDERLELYKREAQNFIADQAEKDAEVRHLRHELDEMRRTLRDYLVHSEQLKSLEEQIAKLTRGLVVYGRAFELSVGDDEKRGLNILDRALDEINSRDDTESTDPQKKVG